MITKVRFRNFQCHKDKTIHLDRVTTIIGENRQGKSASFRGLEWLFLNKAPKARGGKINLHNWNEKPVTSVTAWFDDGHKLTRKKSKTANVYILDGVTYKAVGKGGVPDEVKKILHISEDNFQRQFSSLFWFAESPAQISKRLNKIVNQSIIDNVAKELSTNLKRSKIELSICKERISEATIQKKQTLWAVAARDVLIQIESIDTEIISKEMVLDAIAKQVEQARETKTRISVAQKLVAASQSLSEIFDEAEARQKRFAEVFEQVVKAKILQERIDLFDTIEDPSELEKQFLMMDERRKKWQRVMESVKEAKSLQARIDSNTSMRIAVEKKLRKVSQGSCPVCGSPLSPEKVISKHCV